MGGEASLQVCVPWPASSARLGLGRGPGLSGLDRSPASSVACGQRVALLSIPVRVPPLRPCWLLREGRSPFSSWSASHRPWMEGGSLPPRPDLAPDHPTLNSPPRLEEDWKGRAQQVHTPLASREVCLEPSGPLPASLRLWIQATLWPWTVTALISDLILPRGPLDLLGTADPFVFL